MIDKLNAGIKYLYRRKACSSDRIFNEYLLNCGDVLKNRILDLFNLIWCIGYLLRSFINSIIVPIIKEGNTTTKDPNNFRLVALTSCLCKLCERLVINRMVYFIEYNQLFKHTESTYKIVRSPVDPLMRLVADVNMGFNKNSLSILYF